MSWTAFFVLGIVFFGCAEAGEPLDAAVVGGCRVVRNTFATFTAPLMNKLTGHIKQTLGSKSWPGGDNSAGRC